MWKFIVQIFTLTALAASQLTDLDCIITDYSQVSNIVENCKNIIIYNLTVPAGKTLTLQLTNDSTLEFRGIITFEYFEWKGPLLKIKGNNIYVKGTAGHVIYGKGEEYWDGLGSKGTKKPKFVTISANNSIFEDIHIKNCPVHCISVSNVNNITISGWNIDVSEGNKNNFTGHNTDGFDVSGKNIIIKDTIVKNQDDCVVINRGSNILVSNVSCYGGHGLSISVGFSTDDFESNSVHNVTFKDSLVSFSPNGIHIKTHTDSGNGIISNVIYKNIRFERITNFAINIQQDYSDGESTGFPGTNIPIVGLQLTNITGFMESFNESPTLANYILCGDGACSNWKFKNIDIVGAQNDSFCNFVPKGYNC